MGYSETYCHLCGVTFNIGRLRVRGEPRTSAWHGTADWDTTRQPAGNSWVKGLRDWHTAESCSTERTGCFLVYRGDPNRANEPACGTPEHLQELLDDIDGDEDWLPRESEDLDHDVVEEWQSDVDQTKTQPTEEFDDGFDTIMTDDPDQKHYVAFCDSFETAERTTQDSGSITEDYLEFPDPFQLNPGDQFEGRPLDHYEHIAGPHCTMQSGYNGHYISAQDLYGCKTVQALLPNYSAWTPEPDDLVFEIDDHYTLSGLADHFPSRDMDVPRFVPDRHGIEVLMPSVDTYPFESRSGMPFHPPCFEIYIRQSWQRFGRIDAKSLIDWRDHHNANWNTIRRSQTSSPHVDEPAAPDAFSIVPRSWDVSESSSQLWKHRSGSEYLGANPLLIPGLHGILWRASSGVRHIHGQDGVFPLPELGNKEQPSYVEDRFLSLSMELRLAILENLDGPSIANLRICSRAFRQLPQSLFLHLIRRDLPWLWEAAEDGLGDPSPYFWATLTQRDAAKYLKVPQNPRWVEYDSMIEHYRTVIREEMPELYQDWVASEPGFRELYGVQWPPEDREQIRLVKGGTNWFQLYCEIVKGMRNGTLKGLLNRARIWKDVEFIVDRVEEYRDSHGVF